MKKKIIIGSIILIVLIAIIVIIVFASHKHTYSEDYKYDRRYHWKESTCHGSEVITEKGEHQFNSSELVCSVCNYRFEKNPINEMVDNFINNIGYYNADVTITSEGKTDVFKLRYQEMFIGHELIYIDFASNKTTVFNLSENGRIQSEETLDTIYTVEEYLKSNEKYSLLCSLIDAIPIIEINMKLSSDDNVLKFNHKLANSNIKDINGRMIISENNNSICRIEINFTCMDDSQTDSHSLKKYSAKIVFNDVPLEERPKPTLIPEPSEDGYIASNMYEIKELMDLFDKYIIIDARTSKEYAEGHIPGAINVPFEYIKSKKWPERLNGYNGYILVYCNNENGSKTAASKLVEFGFTNVVEFGGIADWQYELEK